MKCRRRYRSSKHDREGQVSFELFMQCFDRGEASGVSAELVRSAFSNFAADSKPDCWHLWYDEANSCHIYVSRDPTRADRIIDPNGGAAVRG
jgi:hypothetical protein